MNTSIEGGTVNVLTIFLNKKGKNTMSKIEKNKLMKHQSFVISLYNELEELGYIFKERPMADGDEQAIRHVVISHIVGRKVTNKDAAYALQLAERYAMARYPALVKNREIFMRIREYIKFDDFATFKFKRPFFSKSGEVVSLYNDDELYKRFLGPALEEMYKRYPIENNDRNKEQKKDFNTFSRGVHTITQLQNVQDRMKEPDFKRTERLRHLFSTDYNFLVQLLEKMGIKVISQKEGLIFTMSNGDTFLLSPLGIFRFVRDQQNVLEVLYKRYASASTLVAFQNNGIQALLYGVLGNKNGEVGTELCQCIAYAYDLRKPIKTKRI